MVVFSRKGAEDATTFDFKCSECNAVSGPTTTVLNTGPGEEPFHVVSKNIAGSDVFIQQRKPHERRDQRTGFARDLLEEFTEDGATHKTFEAFTCRYNRIMNYSAEKEGERLRALQHLAPAAVRSGDLPPP